MYLYLEVTNDEYELPLVVADSLRELARRSGHCASQIADILGGRYAFPRTKFIRVELNDDDEKVFGENAV